MQLKNRADVVVDIGRDCGWWGSESGLSDGEIVEEVVRVPRGRARPPRAMFRCWQ